jgi:hypothetical protein
MVDTRTLALSLLLSVHAGACAAGPAQVAQPNRSATRAESKARADALTMRDLSRSAPESANLGSLKPVPVGTESLGKQATAK